MPPSATSGRRVSDLHGLAPSPALPEDDQEARRAGQRERTRFRHCVQDAHGVKVKAARRERRGPRIVDDVSLRVVRGIGGVDRAHDVVHADIADVVHVQQGGHTGQLRQVEGRPLEGNVLAGQVVQVRGVEQAKAADLRARLRERNGREAKEIDPVRADIDETQLQVIECAEANPFSYTAKSAPAPFTIGSAKLTVIDPPSPRLTTLLSAGPMAAAAVPNDASPMPGLAMVWGPRVRFVTLLAHSTMRIGAGNRIRARLARGGRRTDRQAPCGSAALPSSASHPAAANFITRDFEIIEILPFCARWAAQVRWTAGRQRSAIAAITPVDSTTNDRQLECTDDEQTRAGPIKETSCGRLRPRRAIGQ